MKLRIAFIAELPSPLSTQSVERHRHVRARRSLRSTAEARCRRWSKRDHTRAYFKEKVAGAFPSSALMSLPRLLCIELVMLLFCRGARTSLSRA